MPPAIVKAHPDRARGYPQPRRGSAVGMASAAPSPHLRRGPGDGGAEEVRPEPM